MCIILYISANWTLVFFLYVTVLELNIQATLTIISGSYQQMSAEN